MKPAVAEKSMSLRLRGDYYYSSQLQQYIVFFFGEGGGYERTKKLHPVSLGARKLLVYMYTEPLYIYRVYIYMGFVACGQHVGVLLSTSSWREGRWGAVPLPPQRVAAKEGLCMLGRARERGGQGVYGERARFAQRRRRRVFLNGWRYGLVARWRHPN